VTGFDPTAPNRNTDDDEPEVFEDNVVPPEALTDSDENPTAEGTAPQPASQED
jgi:hypothetical protein